MGEKPHQTELFSDNYAEPVDAPETESVTGILRRPRRRKPKITPVSQKDMFPEDAEEARRIARWRTPEAQAAQKMLIELQKKVLKEQQERKRKPGDVIH